MDFFNKQKVRKLENNLGSILNEIPTFLKAKGGVYRYNEPGSGDVCYSLNGDDFSFNEFPEKFDGFYINMIKVSFKMFMLIIFKQ